LARGLWGVGGGGDLHRGSKGERKRELKMTHNKKDKLDFTGGTPHPVGGTEKKIRRSLKFEKGT